MWALLDQPLGPTHRLQRATVWGTAPGCVSAARSSHSCVVEQLWATRYHVAAMILASGINLLHVDTDAAFLTDPYALLKAPPSKVPSKLGSHAAAKGAKKAPVWKPPAKPKASL